QPSISAFDCQRLMRRVNAFRITAREGWGGGPLEILITGRSAYVAEISLSMRYDIVATLAGSVLLVGSIFFVGFHRWLPLLGMGFSPLGVLIAIGIFVAGLFMCSILFLFIRERQPPVRRDWIFEVVRKYVQWSVQRPAPMLIFSSAFLLLLTAIGFSPVPPLHFEASARSLEPKNSRASLALQKI